MTSDSRRLFLRHFSMTVGSLSLAACGGGRAGLVAGSPDSTGQSSAGGTDTSGASGTSGTSGAQGAGGAASAPGGAPSAPAGAASAPAGAASAPATIAPTTPVPLATDPKWIRQQPLATWFAIPGTVHAGSPAAPADDPKDPYASSNRRLSYSGMGLRGNEVVLAANGGHGDYAGNEVTSIDLSADAPAWQLRSAASTATAQNVAYYPDGRPSSRHTYWSTIWSARHNRLMLHYSRFVYGSGTSFTDSNGFNLDTNTWDAKGTWSPGYSAACADANGDVYAVGIDYFKLLKWTSATDTWSQVAEFGDAIDVAPVCHDSKRDHLFALAWGDGQGNTLDGVSRSLSALRLKGSTKTVITFNPSAALAQFQDDQPNYAAMEYDPVNDQYLFYEGAAGRTGRVYVVKPNETSVWDLSVMSLTAGSVAPPAAEGAGVFNRFKYVAALRGFVLMAAGTSELYFLRTA